MSSRRSSYLKSNTLQNDGMTPMLKRRMTLHKLQTQHLRKQTEMQLAYIKMDIESLVLHGRKPW